MVVVLSVGSIGSVVEPSMKSGEVSSTGRVDGKISLAVSLGL